MGYVEPKKPVRPVDAWEVHGDVAGRRSAYGKGRRWISKKTLIAVGPKDRVEAFYEGRRLFARIWPGYTMYDANPIRIYEL